MKFYSFLIERVRGNSNLGFDLPIWIFISEIVSRKTYESLFPFNSNEAWLESDRDTLWVSAEVPEYQKRTFWSQIDIIDGRAKFFIQKSYVKYFILQTGTLRIQYSQFGIKCSVLVLRQKLRAGHDNFQARRHYAFNVRVTLFELKFRSYKLIKIQNSPFWFRRSCISKWNTLMKWFVLTVSFY